MKYLVIDSESTNIKINENNLIEVYFGIFDNRRLIDELHLKLIPDNGLFLVNPDSMRINNIDLRNINLESYTKYSNARKIIGEFLMKHSTKGKLKVIGHGVSGDINAITSQLISLNSWKQNVSVLILDTLSISSFLCDIGVIQPVNLTLAKLCEYFKIKITDLHTAKGDAILSYRVYNKLSELVTKIE